MIAKSTHSTNENEMGIKIAKATLMGLMVAASLTLFGAIVLV